MEDKCIICGSIIPEGRQVCKACEKECDEFDSLVGWADSVYCGRAGRDAADGPVLRKQRLRGDKK